MLLNSCEKEDEKNKAVITTPILSTTEVTQITQTTATSGGNITSDGGATIMARGVCWSTNQNPTINDNKTEDDNGAGGFTSNIIGLEPNTNYYLRAYATNSEGVGYGNIFFFNTLEELIECIDVDGNTYETVKIGTQVWMAENLKTTKYNDDTPILNITSNTEWIELNSGAYVWFDNNEAIYKDAYGALYNWFAVETGNLCPIGWHVPSEAEWTTLLDYVGEALVAGGKLKSTLTAPDPHPRWESPNSGATDEYGFSSLPGGSRYYDGFYYVGRLGYWWSSTEHDATGPRFIFISFDRESVGRNYHFKNSAFSVRCLRD